MPPDEIAFLEEIRDELLAKITISENYQLVNVIRKITDRIAKLNRDTSLYQGLHSMDFLPKVTESEESIYKNPGTKETLFNVTMDQVFSLLLA